MKPLISVIIPTYQRRNKLKSTLESILTQTYSNYEVLIMDDGSTDGTKEMVHSFKDSRIFYNWQKNTGGPGNPRNRGIRLAKGDWIAFLDSDDSWKENKLNEIYKQINDKNDFIYHDYSVISDEHIKKKVVRSSYLKDPKSIDLLINGNVIALSTVVVRKKLLLNVNGFNEDIRMAACADYNAWLKISHISKNFFYLPKNLGYYMVDEYNMSNQDMTIPKKLAIKEFLYLLTNKQKKSLDAKFRYESGCFNYYKKNYKEAINLFWVALRFGSLFIKIKSFVRLLKILIEKSINKVTRVNF